MHFFDSSALPPYPEPTLQMVLSCGKWQMKRRPSFRSAFECSPRVKSFRAAEMVERHLTHPGHQPHVEGDVDAVGQLDADLAEREPVGPIRNGTTYIVRPFIEPEEDAAPTRSYASAGAIQ